MMLIITINSFNSGVHQGFFPLGIFKLGSFWDLLWNFCVLSCFSSFNSFMDYCTWGLFFGVTVVSFRVLLDWILESEVLAKKSSIWYLAFLVILGVPAEVCVSLSVCRRLLGFLFLPFGHWLVGGSVGLWFGLLASSWLSLMTEILGIELCPHSDLLFIREPGLVSLIMMASPTCLSKELFQVLCCL